MARPIPRSTRTLIRTLAAAREDGSRRSVRGVVAALAELGHKVSRATVGRVLGPPARPCRRGPRPSRAKPPTQVLAGAALRLGGDLAGALVLLELVAGELRASVDAGPLPRPSAGA